jgi:hypothetical protein
MSGHDSPVYLLVEGIVGGAVGIRMVIRS